MQPARARRALGRGARRSSCASAEQFRVAAAAGARQRRVRGRVRRGEAPRRRRRHHADRAHARSRRSIGIFWAYDGTPSLCAPPRLYNQITVQIADQMGVEHGRAGAAAGAGERRDGRRRHRRLGVEVLLRLLAPGHRHPRVRSRHRARPGSATAIRRPSAIRPSRRSARRPATCTGPNFTPPFPSYPSGHAGFGGALFQTLRRFYGTDRIAVHLRLGRVQRRDAWTTRATCARCCRALHIAVAGRGGERPEPHLPRHPLGVRQDRGHRPGPPRRRLRLRPRLRAVAAVEGSSWVARYGTVAPMPDFSLFGDEHVRQYEATGGKVGHDWNGTSCLILHTTGRRSGATRKLPLIYARDGERLRDRRLQGRRAGAPGLVPEPGRPPRRGDPGMGRRHPGHGAHRNRRGQGPRLAAHDGSNGPTTTVPGQDAARHSRRAAPPTDHCLTPRGSG